MNILIIGTGKIEQNLINLCVKSRLLDHLYTASLNPLDDIPNIEYNSFEDLVHKAKILQTDIVLVADKNLIQQGVVEILKKYFINVISVNQKWFNLEKSRIAAKQLSNYYAINNPEVIKVPVVFPIVLKTDRPNISKIVNSMSDLIKITESLSGEKFFLEEYLKGEVFYLLSLWDGKNLLNFPSIENLTEVQEDRLNLLKTKLNFMFSDEKANFIGFFTTKLIWAKNDWFVLDYVMHINEKSDLDVIKSDFLYILDSAIYQKLNELNFS